MKSRALRALVLAAAMLALTSCTSVSHCDAPPAQPPAGSPLDVHPLAVDAGFFLEGPFDAGVPALRVTAVGPAMHPVCHWADAGGYFEQYPDGGSDFYESNGQLVDPDGGCRSTDALEVALDAALNDAGLSPREQIVQPDGTAVLLYGFHHWKSVDPAVQIVGSMLVDSGFGGPVELQAEFSGGAFCL